MKQFEIKTAEKELDEKEVMWYVIQIRTGTEESIRVQCEKLIPEKILSHCFVIYREERRNIRGEWRTLKKTLFPGYLFLVAENVSELKAALRQVIGLTKLLTIGEDIIPLSEAEVQLLKRLAGEQNLVGMSEGIIAGEKVKVINGPLVGMEGSIRKIDRHKRKAWLEVTMFGKLQEVQVGLEVLEKKMG